MVTCSHYFCDIGQLVSGCAKASGVLRLRFSISYFILQTQKKRSAAYQQGKVVNRLVVSPVSRAALLFEEEETVFRPAIERSHQRILAGD